MRVLSHSWLIATAALGVVLVVDGCGSPLWRRDNYRVEGALLGTTCEAAMDGRYYDGNSALVGERIRFAIDGNGPPGVTITTFICRGIALTFVTPYGVRPATGHYRISGGAVGYDTGSVRLYIAFSRIKEGAWPLAPTGILLEAKEGYLQLDEITDSTARGTFHAIVRRQPNGE